MLGTGNRYEFRLAADEEQEPSLELLRVRLRGSYLKDPRGPRSSDSERDSVFRSVPKSIDSVDEIREFAIVVSSRER